MGTLTTQGADKVAEIKAITQKVDKKALLDE